MTNAQFKKGINAEMKEAGITRQISKVTNVGIHTTLVFKNGYDMKTLKWLNFRFAYGIAVTDTDHSLVFINTPMETKVEF